MARAAIGVAAGVQVWRCISAATGTPIITVPERSRRRGTPMPPVSRPAGSRTTAAATLAIALALSAWLAALSPAPARADDAPAQLPACGFTLTDPIFQKWTADGGEAGRHGLPGREGASTSSTAASGATGVQANFTGGASILWQTSGGHAGQTYTVQGCFYRLYAQYGGASGWLGLPTADATSTNDGQTQPFEGGTMTYVRAERTCSGRARPAGRRPAVGAHDVALDKADRATLDLYFDPTRQEYFTSAAGLGAEPNPERYQKVRSEAYVFVRPSAGHRAAARLLERGAGRSPDDRHGRGRAGRHRRGLRLRRPAGVRVLRSTAGYAAAEAVLERRAPGLHAGRPRPRARPTPRRPATTSSASKATPRPRRDRTAGTSPPAPWPVPGLGAGGVLRG